MRDCRLLEGAIEKIRGCKYFGTQKGSSRNDVHNLLFSPVMLALGIKIVLFKFAHELIPVLLAAIGWSDTILWLDYPLHTNDHHIQALRIVTIVCA
jgi:hypothetical protein